MAKLTIEDFLANMLEKGKITQRQIDEINARNIAKSNYVKMGDKMSVSELREVLDMLTISKATVMRK